MNLPDSVCCGTIHIRYGPERTEERPLYSGKFKTSRRVFHIRGRDRFWHWLDQTDKLAEGYGP